MSMTDRDKAFSLRDLDDVIVKFNERNKKGATIKIEKDGPVVLLAEGKELA